MCGVHGIDEICELVWNAIPSAFRTLHSQGRHGIIVSRSYSIRINGSELMTSMSSAHP